MLSGWKRIPRCFSACLYFPSTYTQTHTLQGTQGQNKRFGGINPNFKSSAFRSARITHSNLPALTPLFPHLCLLACASSPPSRPPSYTSPPTLLPLFSSHSIYVSLLLSHNSLSHHYSLYSINSLSPYFIVPCLHSLLFIHHPIYLSLSVKVSEYYSAPLPTVYLFMYW